MKRFIRLAAAMLAVAIGLSACGGDTSWVYVSGEDRVSAGLYILYQVGAFSKAAEVLAEENKDNANYVVPEAKELLKTTIEGKTGADWINDSARQSVCEGFIVNQKFDELGLSLTDSDRYSIENGVSQTMSQMPVFYEKNGVSQESIRAYYTVMTKRSALFLKMYGEGGEFATPVDELKNYFKDNYAVIDVMILSKPASVPEGETRTLEELTGDVRATAEDYRQMLADGQEIEQLSYDWELKNAEGAESESIEKPEKGDLRAVLSEESRSNYGDKIVDAALGAKIGEPQVLEDDYYFVLFVRSDNLEDPTVFDTYKDVVLSKLKYSEYQATIADLGAHLLPFVNEAALNRYKPSKIDFNAGSSSK